MQKVPALLVSATPITKKRAIAAGSVPSMGDPDGQQGGLPVRRLEDAACTVSVSGTRDLNAAKRQASAGRPAAPNEALSKEDGLGARHVGEDPADSQNEQLEQADRREPEEHEAMQPAAEEANETLTETVESGLIALANRKQVLLEKVGYARQARYCSENAGIRTC